MTATTDTATPSAAELADNAFAEEAARLSAEHVASPLAAAEADQPAVHSESEPESEPTLSALEARAKKIAGGRSG